VTRGSDSLELHIESYGQGSALVLAHGFGGSARNFRALARGLRGRYRTVLYDARGHARSPAPREPEAYVIEALVDDFARVARTIGEQRVVAGGLSLGATTALEYVLAHPDGVRALVLAAYPAGGDAGRRWALAFADAIEERGVSEAAAEFVSGPQSRFDKKGAALIRQGFAEHQAHALVQLLRHTIAVFPPVQALSHSLAKLSVPVLVIVGSKDERSLEASEQLVELLPDAKLEVIEGAGHVVNLAAPREFQRVLERFLDDVLRDKLIARR